ncbi:hypothetical protein BKA70DRAFT_1419260 [Coprinopsis sp. MPI-PUGE-AT-0042]|nr:hypothetical protein BKA70DRAFT_1419260 [Coprinopsis sp. MPI-PUGE-AT-0042]
MKYGGPLQKALLSDLSFYFNQAVSEGKGDEFMDACCNLFFERFPEPNDDSQESINQRKAMKRMDLYWCSAARGRIRPQLHWRRVFQLNPIAYERFMRPLRLLHEETRPRPTTAPVVLT